MASSNILQLPFRRTHSVSLSDAITKYISTKYDQHPSTFKDDLEEIDRLRNLAVHAQEPHVSSIRKLQEYAAQLVWLAGKFPIDIGVGFVWYPALGYQTERPVSQNNLRFELANILWNLAAMYSQLAFSANRNTTEGLKSACNYFSFSAGVLSHLKSNILPDLRATPPEDMDLMTLECLEHLMLAEAQECFWQKADKDGLRDASISKLAAKVSDFYGEAMEFGVKSDVISSEWIHHFVAKNNYFAATAQYRAACDCLEKRKYGEEVARLKDSMACVNEAMKEQRYINKAVLGDLNGLKSRVQENLRRAEKDNDIIYLMPVPPKSELKTLDRATMVQSKIPKEVSDPLSCLGDHGELGKPLFAKLVPYAVHVAASLYADRRDRLVNGGIIDVLDALTAKVPNVLASLNLPGSLQALEKPLGLPPGLVSHAEEIRQQDGMNRILRSIRETEQLQQSDMSIYQEAANILQTEAAEDDQARRKYGTDRWRRPASKDAHPKLWNQVREIDNYFKAASASDATVLEKVRENEKYIQLLAGSNHDLEHFVPSSRRTALPPALDQAVIKLRACLNDIDRMHSKRRHKIEELRNKAKQDDINPELLKEAARLEREYPMQRIEAAQFEEFFERRLEMYKADESLISEEENTHQNTMKRLREANAQFVTARKGDTTTKAREQALQRLENAFYKYKEIISNLDAGRKFYNDLAKIVTKFRDECRSFAYERRTEAQRIESDITAGMTARHLEKAAALQQRRHAELTGSQQAPTQNPTAQEPLAAPHPTRATTSSTPNIWSEGMPIRFAGSPTSNSQPPGQNGGQQQSKDWDPSKGIRFS